MLLTNIKKIFPHLWLILLVAYSVVLMLIEVKTSQDFVYHFFTDIKGEVPFYAVNTIISVFLLLATGLIFRVNLALLPLEKISTNQIRFYRSQAILFCYLAFDDLFLVHEELGYILGINDAFLLFSLGAIELISIAIWGDFQQWNKATKSYLYKAAICFSIMVMIDGAFPREMILRLSLEDLAKTWANVYLFLFAWDILRQNIAIANFNQTSQL